MEEARRWEMGLRRAASAPMEFFPASTPPSAAPYLAPPQVSQSESRYPVQDRSAENMVREWHEAQQQEAARAAQAALAARRVAGQESILNDPFLTHSQAARREGGAAVAAAAAVAALVGPPGNGGPFQEHHNAEADVLTNVTSDPYLMGDGASAKMEPDAAYWQQRPTGFPKPAASGRLGDPDRSTLAGRILVLAPVLIFTLELLLCLLLRRYSQVASVVLTILVFAGCSALVAMWGLGRRSGRISLLALGSLCLLGAVAGVLVGHVGWDQHWRQYWWTQTGQHYEYTAPDVPGYARADASVISFRADAEADGPSPSVDYEKSAGFWDGSTYCAAPVLTADDSDGTGLTRVNYWAIGIDCCSLSGSFTCDDSRNHAGGYGVVMLDGGLPCPGCNQDSFQAAVAKAESTHGLVSAPGAVYVRWVRDPYSVELALYLRASLFIIIAVLVAVLVFTVLGGYAWFYGIGKRLSPDAAEQRLRDTQMFHLYGRGGYGTPDKALPYDIGRGSVTGVPPI